MNFLEGYVAASLEYVARVALSNISEYEAALREDDLDGALEKMDRVEEFGEIFAAFKNFVPEYRVGWIDQILQSGVAFRLGEGVAWYERSLESVIG